MGKIIIIIFFLVTFVYSGDGIIYEAWVWVDDERRLLSQTSALPLNQRAI